MLLRSAFRVPRSRSVPQSKRSHARWLSLTQARQDRKASLSLPALLPLLRNLLLFLTFFVPFVSFVVRKLSLYPLGCFFVPRSALRVSRSQSVPRSSSVSAHLRFALRVPQSKRSHARSLSLTQARQDRKASLSLPALLPLLRTLLLFLTFFVIFVSFVVR